MVLRWSLPPMSNGSHKSYPTDNPPLALVGGGNHIAPYPTSANSGIFSASSRHEILKYWSMTSAGAGRTSKPDTNKNPPTKRFNIMVGLINKNIALLQTRGRHGRNEHPA